jgi:hypothetical protein
MRFLRIVNTLTYLLLCVWVERQLVLYLGDITNDVPIEIVYSNILIM